VEDRRTRQVPGNARAADRWSAEGSGSRESTEGWGMACCQQAVAFCRVNRAQPKDAPAASAAQPGSAAMCVTLLDKNRLLKTYAIIPSGVNVKTTRKNPHAITITS